MIHAIMQLPPLKKKHKCRIGEFQEKSTLELFGFFLVAFFNEIRLESLTLLHNLFTHDNHSRYFNPVTELPMFSFGTVFSNISIR